MDQRQQPIPIEGADLSLKTLQNELHGICTKWYLLGIQLEIEIGTLKGIKQECREVAGLCLVEVLNEWLKNQPSWKGLVEALKSPPVDEVALADKIEREHCLPDLPDDDIFNRNGAHSTRPHYSASFPANWGRHVPRHEYHRSSEPNCLPETETKNEKLIQEQKKQIEQLKRQLQEKENQVQVLMKSQERSLPKGIRGSAAIEENVAYFRIGEDPYVHEYDSGNDKWRCIYPECPFLRFGIAVINGFLTAVGGLEKYEVVGTLLSLTGVGTDKKWSEKFKPMPTKRLFPGIGSYRMSLIVAGGTSSGLDGDSLRTVEVMDTETSQWTIAKELPHPFLDAWLTICGNKVYMLGGNNVKTPTKSALTCSLNDLYNTSEKWDTICDVPVCSATCATVNGQLLAVGGKHKGKNCTSIYAFDQTEGSWKIIHNMETARSFCLAVALPNNKLIIVGGFIQCQNLYDVPTNCVEIIDIPVQSDSV